MDAPAPQGLPRAQGGLEPALPRAQGGLEPARAAVVRGGSSSMRTAINAQSPSAPRQVRHSDYILNLRLPRTVTEIMVFEEIIRHSPRRRASPCIAEGFSPAASAVERNIFSISISPTASAVERIYSSSHKDWSCWAGLHLPSKADAVCALPPRAPRLCAHQTGSHGGAEARRSGAQRKRAPYIDRICYHRPFGVCQNAVMKGRRSLPF